MSAAMLPATERVIVEWMGNWPKMARDVFGVHLDSNLEDILWSAQTNQRTVVRSGHARGKDFVAGLAALCHHYSRIPSKTILTAPTGRQALGITLAEAKKSWQTRQIPLGGTWLADSLVMQNAKGERVPDHFILAFKAADKSPESWTGWHSPNIMVIVTEASGIEQETFDALEGLLTGNSRLLLCMNPNRTTGETYQAFKNPLYAKFTLSCLDAPNVVARKMIYPGQVDWEWINDLIQKPGWVTELSVKDACSGDGDFEWDALDGRGPVWYRPGDLFRVKVLGQWPHESEDQLIPLAWVEASNERWKEWQHQGSQLPESLLRLGVDVAGMGSDLTCLCYRYGPVVSKIEFMAHSDHMATAGRVKEAVKNGRAFVDTIGEGAGVHSRLIEQRVKSISVKFSESAADCHDETGERDFRNMRAYCWWALRDALDPKFGATLALPPLDALTQDLTAPRWTIDSQGKIILEDKDSIRSRLGRSPDAGDALANTFYPDMRNEPAAPFDRRLIGA